MLKTTVVMVVMVMMLLVMVTMVHASIEVSSNTHTPTQLQLQLLLDKLESVETALKQKSEIITTTAMSTAIDTHRREIFHQYASIYNRPYLRTTTTQTAQESVKSEHNSEMNVEEMEKRYQIWSHNVDVILQHNQEARQGVHSYQLGLTKWADVTNQEFRQRLTYRHGLLSNKLAQIVSTSSTASTSTSTSPSSRSSSFELASLPAAVDWRNQSVVTPVKDQGSCGACWTFSCTGAMEGAWAFNNNQLVSFSEQQLLDCVANGQDDCNTGGDSHDGFNYAIANGSMTEHSYPYLAASSGSCNYDPTQVVGRFTAMQDVSTGSESDLQTAIYTYPGVSIAIDASSEQFQLYLSGVFNLPTCKNGDMDLDHAVFLVGYGTDPTGGDYWIVKNSWGPEWGQSGYIWMSRNKNNQCGVATEGVVITI